MGVHGESIDGGCEVAADPAQDACDTHPLWLSEDEGLVHVRAARAHHAPAPAHSQHHFDLWRIPGRKHLIASAGFILSVSIGSRHVRILLDAGLADGSAYVCTVPLTAHLRGQLAEFQALGGLLEGMPPHGVRSHAVSRAGLLHLRALQALDAMQAGASHRDLAVALFGLEAVRAGWHADGVLRAQVRHLVARAEGFMRQGYLCLAGLRQEDAGAHGDESMR
ncbi:hypothetical protein APR50_37500 [Variovorax paradoxus]|jgi:hypothetical protein|uniref:DUF2285 domain-containing protein n=1 Tax=Variovorax TaxID=34072 RepID=UPI0006E6FBCD|nr:DUF2285 domain-containing protein [Variovorax sp.]KPU94620.1 hypothetical protein APR50_37500 [Variovorax paradoxus]KPU94941.1 hypothetical protein APR52_19330 [Variovorax paradoxus]KPU96165.1 hypothetical protein APR49_36825 [Variovorax paradoxus]KPV15118.1 hypothetical protein APR51_35960 [Variovorax paradoxus]KPV29999.1 hypothetical protein APR47_24865 [Variovorax paradoxus]